MGVNTTTIPARTTTTYTCDRCGRTTSNALVDGRYANVVVEEIAMGHDGGTGGRTSRLWLCSSCTGALQEFLATPPPTKQVRVRQGSTFTREGHVAVGTTTDRGWATDVEGEPVVLDGHRFCVVERTSALLGSQTLLVDADGAMYQVGDADSTGRRHVWSLDTGCPLNLGGVPVDLFEADGQFQPHDHKDHQ